MRIAREAVGWLFLAIGVFALLFLGFASANGIFYPKVAIDGIFFCAIGFWLVEPFFYTFRKVKK